MSTANAAVVLQWTGKGLAFEGGAPGGPVITVEGGGGRLGPSPMQTLLLAVAGCTASDIVEILDKMRMPAEALQVRLEGTRAVEPPRRFTALRFIYEIRGLSVEDEPKLRRAVALSHETYCSALHSLRTDIEVVTEIVRQ